MWIVNADPLAPAEAGPLTTSVFGMKSASANAKQFSELLFCLIKNKKTVNAWHMKTKHDLIWKETFLSQKVTVQGALRCEIKITPPLLISVKGNVP